MRRTKPAAAFTWVLLASWWLWGAEISTQNLSLSVRPADMALEQVRICGEPIRGVGGVTFYDGKAEIFRAPSNLVFETKTHGLSCRHTLGDPAVRAAHTVEAREDHIRWRVTLSNASEEERWFEVTIALPCFSLDGSQYWDGFNAYKALDRRIRRDDMAGLFPLSAVYRDNGIAVGIDAHEMRSYLRAELDPASRRVSYSTRMVLGPNGTDSITFVAFGFRNHFGWRDAVQHYYDIFPEIFQPRPDIDPRINGPCIRYLFWSWSRAGSQTPISATPRNAFELIRRASCFGTDWCYAAACGARVGDWWPSKYTLNWKTWKLDPKTKQKIDVIWDEAMIREYLEERGSRLARGDEYNIAAMAYTIPTFCEEDLARQHFPECIVDPKDPKVRIRYDPWVYRTQNCLRIYAYGNRFGEKTLRDVERTAKEWPWLPGFAFDCGVPAIPHYGAGARQTPGRAYEKDKGVYALCATAVAKVAEKIHSLTNQSGYRMGVITNLDGSECYQCWFAADAGIYEAPPQHHLYGYDPIHVRLWLGKKPLTWWKYYVLPNLASLSKEELNQSLQALIDYTLLYSLYLGAYPNPYYVLGVPKMIHYMPILQDLNRLGWEPAPGFTAEKTLWHSRYGKGVGSCIVLGNYQVEPVQTDVVLKNSYLGPITYILAEYEGSPTSCSLRGAETVLRGRTLQSGEALILRAVAGIRGDTTGMSAASRIRLTEGEPGSLQIDINSAQDARRDLVFWRPPGYFPTEVVLNGQRIDFQETQEGICCQAPLRKGTNRFHVQLAPEIVVENKAALLDYPFFEEEQPNCEILLGSNATHQEELMAVWIWNYFRFFDYIHGNSRLKGNIPVRKGEKAGATRCIILGTPKTNPLLARTLPPRVKGKVALENGDIIIVADSLASLKATVLMLLKTLDQKYVFYGYFVGVAPAVGGAAARGPRAPGANPFKPWPGSEEMGIAETGGYVPWHRK